MLTSVVTGVSVSTLDCVVNGPTQAACGFATDDAVRAAHDVYSKASVVIEAKAAILGGASTFETALKAELVIAVLVCVIIRLNVGCANRLETGSVVLKD